ncbi:MAG TPA: hypothetical protein VK131_04825, partial [Candidatus Acidoferrales bacterium]|nr:hypothetical protein [Candidatus Acidoferrales bacterium]
MSSVQALIGSARGRVFGSRAVGWSARGLAVAAVAALLAEVFVRQVPVDPDWPLLAGAAAAGALVVAVGLARAWPSAAQVARLLDRGLGSRERLSTALEFAGQGGLLVQRQRADAERWAGAADAQSLSLGGWPLRAAAVALGAGLVALLIS